MQTYLLLLLPSIVFAGIQVQVKTGTNEQDAAVNVKGSSIGIITDKERATFKIQDGPLKDAVKKYSGGRPDDAYVKSPTPWNDLYQRFGWRQVQRVVYPVNAKILSVHSEPVIVSTQEFVNNSTVKVTYNAGISQNVQDTVSNTWSVGGELSVGQEITYSVDLGAAEVGGSTSISFSASWGEETSKSRTVTVGSTSGVQVQLEPGQRVLATLSATKGSMEVEVEYEANLEGDVACNYPNKFQDHYFWRYAIDDVLRAAELPQTVVSKEIMKIDFYQKALVKVDDVQTSLTLSAAPAVLRMMDENKH